MFPQTANREIKAYAAAIGIEIKGADCTPLGSIEFSTMVSKVRNAKAGTVFNMLNCDSNAALLPRITRRRCESR